MMIPRLRIAILECDEPVGKTKEKYGSYGGLFTELLQNGAIRLASEDHGRRPELDISSYDIVNKDVYPKLDDVDAVLLTGSSKYRAAGIRNPGGTCADQMCVNQNTIPSTMTPGS